MNHVYILGGFAQLHRGERWNVPSYPGGKAGGGGAAGGGFAI